MYRTPDDLDCARAIRNAVLVETLIVLVVLAVRVIQ